MATTRTPTPPGAVRGVREREPEHASIRAPGDERSTRLCMSKWDGTVSKVIPVVPLGTDRFGWWYRWPAGRPMHRRSGPPVRHRRDMVLLVSATRGWIARWGAAGGFDLYCDVTTPPVISDDGVDVVDLDLDVVRFADGRSAVVDQDEFEDRRRVMGYPDEVAAQAVATARWLYAAVTAGEEPFASAGPGRLSTLPAATESAVARRLIGRHDAAQDPVRAALIRDQTHRIAESYRHAAIDTYLPILVERAVEAQLGPGVLAPGRVKARR